MIIITNGKREIEKKIIIIIAFRHLLNLFPQRGTTLTLPSTLFI